MPEEVTVREDVEVIQVTSYGDVTMEDFSKTLNSILKIREDRGLAKIFVDGTAVTSYPSTSPVFDFGSQVADSLRGIRVAIVATLNKRDESLFFETVARNRGGHVSVFDSPDAALAWLTE
ncbi:MAG: hypothetical protein ACYSUP_18125 [Planctomycetota bacterium]|jgi:hypothetical protein